MSSIRISPVKRLEKAIALLNKALVLSPDSLPIHERLALFYERIGDRRAASERLRVLIDAYAESKNQILLRNTLTKLVELSPEDTSSWIQLASFYRDEGLQSERLITLEKLLEILIAQESLSGTTEICEEILSINPDRSDIRSKLIQIQEKSGLQQHALAERRALASGLAKQGNYQEALLQYQGILVLAPNDPEALEKLAFVREQLGQFEEASRIYLQLASLSEASSNFHDAAKWCAKSVEKDPGAYDAWNRLAIYQENLGDNDEASRSYQRAASLYQQRQDYTSAEECYRRWRDLSPNSTEARESLIRLFKSEGRRREAVEELINLASLRHEQGDSKGSCSLYEEAFAENQDSLAVAFQLGELYRETEQYQSFCQLYEKLAERRSEKGDLEGSVALYTQVIQVCPDRIESLQSLATTYHAMGKSGQAVDQQRALARILNDQAEKTSDRSQPVLLSRVCQTLREACIWVPENFEAHADLARAEARMGQPDRAIEVVGSFCRRLLSLHDSKSASYDAGELRKNAESLLAEGEKIHPDSPALFEIRAEVVFAFGDPRSAGDSLLKAGVLRESAKDLESALGNFLRAKDLCPDSEEPLIRIVDLLEKRGDASRATEYARQLVERYREKKKFREASEYLDRVLRLSPDDVQVYVQRVSLAIELGDAKRAVDEAIGGADALTQRHRIAEALELCRRARELTGVSLGLGERIISCLTKLGDVRGAISESTELAYLYHSQGNLDAARALLESAVVLDPSNTPLRRILADCLAGLGRDDDSKRELLILAKLYADSGLSEKSVEVLRDLRTRFPSDRAIQKQLLDLLIREKMQRSAAQEGLAFLNDLWKETLSASGAVFTSCLSECRALAEQLLAFNPDMIDVIDVYASVLERLNETDAYATQKVKQAALIREQGDFSAAIKCLSDALLRAPGNPTLTEALDKTRSDSLKVERKSSFAERIEKAEQTLNAGQTAEAILAYETLVGEESGNPELLLALGRAYGKVGRRQEMLTSFLDAADLYKDRKAAGQAIKTLSTLLDAEPNFIPALERIVQFERETVPEKAMESFLTLGFAYREKGDLQRAANAYRDALKIRPDNPAALQVLSDILWTSVEQAEMKSASVMPELAQSGCECLACLEVASRKLMDLRHEDEAVQLLFTLRERAERFGAFAEEQNGVSWESAVTEAWRRESEARALLSPLLEAMGRREDFLRIEMASIERLVERNQAEAAVSALEPIIFRYPKDLPARELLVFLLTEALEKERNKAGEQQIFTGTMLVMKTSSDREAEITRSIVEHRTALAALYLQEGERPKALSQYEVVVQLDPSAGDAREALVGLYLERGETEKGIAHLQALANHYREKGLLGNVLELYQRALEIDGGNRTLMKDLAYVYAEQGLLDKASRLLRRGADLVWSQGDYSAAVEILEQAISIEPNNVTLLAKMCRAHLAMGNDEKAEGLYSSLIDVYCERGLFSRAEQIIEKDLEEYSDRVDLWRTVARVWQKRNHTEQAIALLEKLQQIHPDPGAQKQIETLKSHEEPTASFKPKKTASARSALSGGLSTNYRPDDFVTMQSSQRAQSRKDLFAQAQTNYERRRYSIATTQLQELLELTKKDRTPDEALEIYNLMGLCHSHLKEYSQACEMFRKGLAVENPNTSTLKEIRYNLALVLEENGQIDEAIELWKHIYSTDPSYRDIKTKILSIHLKKKVKKE